MIDSPTSSTLVSCVHLSTAPSIQSIRFRTSLKKGKKSLESLDTILKLRQFE